MRDSIITRFLSVMSSVFATLIGRFSWQSPTWLTLIANKLQRFYRDNTRLTLFMLSTLFLLIIATISFTYWYERLPKPIQITASITAPAITPLDKTLQATPVIIDFGTNNDDTFTDKSVAPLAKIGKEVTSGISITPNISGQWLWKNDSELTFTPSQDWPAGQTYQINFDKSVFAKKIKLARYQYNFSTLPFAIDVGELKFYQDLTNPQQTRVVGTINFNFPVDSTSFEQHTYLEMKQITSDQINLAEQRIPLTFTYDKFKRTAYINSALINLPTIPRHADLVIQPGVNPEAGTSDIDEQIQNSVLIPDVGSFLQMHKVDATIAQDENDNPRQLIVIETSLGVSNDELEKHLHVYLLPKDMPAMATQEVQENYEWSQPGEVSDAILSQSTPVNISALPEHIPSLLCIVGKLMRLPQDIYILK